MKTIGRWLRTTAERSVLFSGLLVLDPKGAIALQQRDLMILATALMLLVVIPVLIMTAVIAWRYRARNTSAVYMPYWEHSRIDEFIWWFVPTVIIAALAAITWTSSHELDPYRPLQHDMKPIVIQVVALNWKWLFIYPEEQIASVNHVQFPVNTPIDFRITADAPMNSFWIPELAGQVYAMNGMETRLHVIANEVGEYRGVSANFSGTGFSGMTFTARASTVKDFVTWVDSVRQSPLALTHAAYLELAQPSMSHPVSLYSSVEKRLHAAIIDAYMTPPVSPVSHNMQHQ